MDLCELANRGEIIRCRLHDVFELGRRFVEPSQFEQGATERHTGREVRGVLDETRACGLDGLIQLAGAPMLLRKLRERD